MGSTIERRLSGGHPNSLGDTVAVAEDVLRDQTQVLMEELCATYSCADELVRLRVSSALKRVCGLHRDSMNKELCPRPEWLLQRFDWLVDDVGRHLDQPSAKWSIAQIVEVLEPDLTQDQRHRACELLKANLQLDPDWIVQNTTAGVLTRMAMRHGDGELKKWLVPELTRMSDDGRKSVSSRGKKFLQQLGAT